MWPRIVAGIFIPVGNHYFQALASTLQFVAQLCDRLWLVPATDRAFAYITYMSPPHVALVCSDPPQCAATCGWTKWPVCSGPQSPSGKGVHPNFRSYYYFIRFFRIIGISAADWQKRTSDSDSDFVNQNSWNEIIKKTRFLRLYINDNLTEKKLRQPNGKDPCP